MRAALTMGLSAALAGAMLVPPAQAETAAPAAASTRPARPTTDHHPTLSAAQRAELQAKADASAPPSLARRELPEKRTQRSKTLVDPARGTFVTELSTQSVNYRDAKGAWQPIDNTLRPRTAAGGGWSNGANRYSVALPESLAKPVRVSDGADPNAWVSMQLAPAQTPPALLGGAPAPAVSAARGAVRGPDKAEVAYPDPLPGVDIAYAATGDGVKQTVSLESRARAAALPGGSLTYALSTGPSLSLRLDPSTRVVTAVDGSGRTVLEIPAPFMDDAKGEHSEAVAVSLAPAGTRAWTLTQTPDRNWLAAANRAWPVVVDPTIGYPAPMKACTINSTSSATVTCSGAERSLLRSASSERRMLLQFDSLLDVVPPDAMMSRAGISLHLPNDAAAVPSSVDVRGLTKAWDTNASWANRTASAAWATPGGDRTADVYERVTLSPNGTYQEVNVTRLVQKWVDGGEQGLPHFGFVFQKQNATTSGDLLRVSAPTGGNAPGMYVEWAPRTGVRKGNAAAVREDLSDRTRVVVNPATGNAAVTTQEFSIKGVGLDLTLSHTSQSRNTTGIGVLGWGWASSFSATRIWPWAGGTTGAAETMFYTDGSGGQWTYLRNKNVSNTWARPVGLDMDLAVPDAAHYTLTDRKTHVKLWFKNISATADEVWGLEKIVEKNGNQLTASYSPTLTYPDGTYRLLSVTDTRGRTLSFGNGGGHNYSATDAVGRTVVYDVDGNSSLNDVTDAAGGLVDYTYDGQDRVTEVRVPGGQRTTLSYDGEGRITQLKRVVGGSATDGDDPTWGFSYGSWATRNATTGETSRTTTVTDPEGHTIKYTADPRGRVTRVLNGVNKEVSTKYSPNDDVASRTGATATSGAETSTSTYYGGDAYQLQSSEMPTGAASTFSYGASGDRLYDVDTATDSRGNSNKAFYDPKGNRNKVERRTGTTVHTTKHFLYQGGTDPHYGGTVNCLEGGSGATKAGVLCEERDPLYVAGTSAASTTKHRTAYRYNADGELVRIVAPSLSTASKQIGDVTYEYDDLSRVTKQTDGKGQDTLFGYDALDRRTYVQHDDGSVESYYLGPNPTPNNNGWLNALDEYAPGASVPTRHTVYGRDDLGRQTNIQRFDGPSTFVTAVSTTYDKSSNLRTYTDTGGTTTYGYNNADQLTSLQLPGGSGSCSAYTWASPGTAASKCVVFRVDDDGRRTGTKFPGGTTTQENTLDKSGRVTRVLGRSGSPVTTRLDLGYEYKNAAADGHLVSAQTQATDVWASRKAVYLYDQSDRLTTATTTMTSGGTIWMREFYCYDKAGNRTRYYNSTAATAPNCSTASPTATYTYNDSNQLTAVAGLTPSGATITGTGPSYDLNGSETAGKSQIGRTSTYGDSDQVTSFTPSGGPAIAQTPAGPGNADRLTSGTTSFMQSPTSAAPAWSATAGTTTWPVRDPQGNLVALRIGATGTPASAAEHYVFSDRQGNVRTVVAASTGAVSVQYWYSAFGVVTSTAGSLVQPYRYGGGYTDDATKLTKLGVRYYDPVHGRFTQQDPTRQEVHPYLYAQGCPSTRNDPSGAASIADLIGNIDDAFTIAEAVDAAARGDDAALRQVLISTIAGLGVTVACEFVAGLLGVPTAGISAVIGTLVCAGIGSAAGEAVGNALS